MVRVMKLRYSVYETEDVKDLLAWLKSFDLNTIKSIDFSTRQDEDGKRYCLLIGEKKGFCCE